MTRMEELTLKLADELITDDEATELLSLLESDASLRAEHIELLQLESTLRGQRQSDATARIMSHVKSSLGDRITQSAMTTIREVRRSQSDAVKNQRQRRPTPKVSNPKRFPTWIISVATAALIAFGVMFGRSMHRTPQKQEHLPAADSIGEVAFVDIAQHSGGGPMLIRFGSADIPLVPKAKLLARDRIKTSSRNTSNRGTGSAIDVVLSNGVNCRIGSESDFELTANNDFKLNTGSIYLSASSSSVIVRTIHGNVKASKAAFELKVARDNSQLSVESGAAEFGSEGSDVVSLFALQRSVARSGRASRAESLHPSSFNQWKSLSAQISPPVAMPNLVDNPGFEKALLGWNVGKVLKTKIVTTNVHAGGYALQFHNVKHGVLKDKWDGLIFQNIRIQAGKEYVVSGWLCSELISGGRMSVVWYRGADTSEIKEEVIGNITSGFKWAKLENRVRAPENASFMRLVLAPDSEKMGSVWLDDCVVQEVAR